MEAMLDSETTIFEPLDLPSEESDEEENASRQPRATDAESLFSTEIAGEGLLTRSEEEVLAKRITRARQRVRAILRRARRLTRAALADRGRGVVSPERDFREREAIAILHYARHAVRSPAAARLVGLDRRALNRFIAELTAALADYRVLRDQMVRANVRLVAMLARRYHHPTLTFLDLFQEGTLGLMRAVEKYEPARNVKFSTYASWWIWQQLGRTADTQGSLIRTPVHWNQLRRRLARTQGTAEAGEDDAERVDAEKVDPSRLEAMTQGFRFVSTDTPSDADERPLESMLPSDAVNPENEALHAALGERLETALKELPPREGFIVRQRFGLGNDDSQTLEEISHHLGVSRERVRQLESRALAKLREVCTAQGLRDYLN
jgi:RNA polymerase primary sigma factor